jgi:hypothetical protein
MWCECLKVITIPRLRGDIGWKGWLASECNVTIDVMTTTCAMECRGASHLG